MLWVGIGLLYYFIAEQQTGQTIGKRTMGLKVIVVNGRPLGVQPRRPPQRLGDRLAGTTVVPVSHP